MGHAGRTRWYLKKGARAAVALGASGSGWLAIRTMIERQPRVRALTYHRFGDVPHDPFCVGLDDFERQMRWLAENRRAVSLAAVEAFLAGAAPLADGAVLVTIDDGCPSLRHRALPILQRHRIPAVVFVPAGELAEGRPAHQTDREPADARMGWDDLAAVVAGGCTVGSHSFTHRSLARMPLAAARDEAARSRELIERRTGQRVTAFAYPFGTRADFSADTAALLRAAGYGCAFTSQHGAIRAATDPYTLPRVKIEGGEPSWMFRLAAGGALDPWQWVDRTLWRWQAAGA